MTMMIRVKLVIMIRIAGARERTVRSTMICIAEERFSRFERSGSWSARAASDSFVTPATSAAVLAGGGGGGGGGPLVFGRAGGGAEISAGGGGGEKGRGGGDVGGGKGWGGW